MLRKSQRLKIGRCCGNYQIPLLFTDFSSLWLNNFPTVQSAWASPPTPWAGGTSESLAVRAPALAARPGVSFWPNFEHTTSVSLLSVGLQHPSFSNWRSLLSLGLSVCLGPMPSSLVPPEHWNLLSPPPPPDSTALSLSSISQCLGPCHLPRDCELGLLISCCQTAHLSGDLRAVSGPLCLQPPEVPLPGTLDSWSPWGCSAPAGPAPALGGCSWVLPPHLSSSSWCPGPQSEMLHKTSNKARTMNFWACNVFYWVMLSLSLLCDLGLPLASSIIGADSSTSLGIIVIG